MVHLVIMDGTLSEVMTSTEMTERIMPTVKEIQLTCTPEEWDALCLAVDFMKDMEDDPSILPHEDIKMYLNSLMDKISAINKRLVFASSVDDDIKKQFPNL